MSVLVTVTSGRAGLDLELDDTLPIAELLPDLAEALGVASGGVLGSADGVPLDPGATLQACGVLDGHRLVLAGVPRSPAERSGGAVSGADTRPRRRSASPSAARDVLPCYLAVDTSDSVSGSALDAVEAELGRLVDALRHDPRISAHCRLGLLAFDAEARVTLPLTPVADLGEVPRLVTTRPATDYACLFRLLRRRMERDLEGLRMAGLRPLKPLVVVVTDGRPTRGHWPAAHAAITDPGWEGSADILAFGVGDTAELTLRRIGTAGAYLPVRADGSSPAPRLASLVAPLVSPVGTAVLEALGHLTHEPVVRNGTVATGSVTVATGAGWRSLRELVP